MKVCLKYMVLFPCFMLSCAQKVDLEMDNQTVIYQASMSEERNPYLSCNQFADETFRGYIWSDSEYSDYKDCVYIDITDSPKEFLRNEDLFLQIYPFSIKNEEMNYGSSLSIKTMRKNKDNGEALVLSQIIDTYLVETELDIEPDYFFLDHFFKVCDLEEEWDGLQFVIYERRKNQEKPAPIRITKFLLPPFLVHPEHFRDVHGDALAAFHPFLEYIPELKSQPSTYYDLAEKICRSIL